MISSKLTIKGISKPFLVDIRIMEGFYRVSQRTAIRSNLKTYNLIPNKANSKEGMGVKFNRIKNVCLVHFDIPSGRNMQLIVCSWMNLEDVSKKKGLDKNYIKLIKAAHDIANGKDPEKNKTIFNKIKDAIF